MPMIEVMEGNLALAEHANAVLRLLNEYACDPMGGGKELPAYTRDHLIAELRKRDGAHVILGVVEGETAGLVICFEGFSTFACKPLLNIHDIVVSRKHRGKGLSKLLLQKAEAIALKLGCCKLTLEVLEGNHAAQAAYRASGFTGYELDPRMGKAMFWEKKLSKAE